MQPPDLAPVLRRLEPTGWVASARRFTASLRGAGHDVGRLLVVGGPDGDPWHLAAHLDDAARWGGAAELRPVLVRREVPDGAPPHLAVGLDAVHRAGRGTTLLVTSGEAVDDALLERLDDAARGGAAVLALHPGGGPLDDLARDRLLLPPVGAPPPVAAELAGHVVTSRALLAPRRPWWRAATHLRATPRTTNG